MNRVLYWLLIVLSIITLHPGRTDANGGHYDRSTGEYHYHHGYPAHQHPNGVCPYESKTVTVQKSVSAEEPEKPKKTIWEILETVFLVFVAVYSVYRIVWFFFVQPRLEEAFRRKRNMKAYSSARKIRPQIPEPPVEKVQKFLPSPEQRDALDHLTEREERILLSVSEIVSQYLDGYDYYKNPEFISAIAASSRKIKEEYWDGVEYTAKRIISRACYSYLLYLKNNNLMHDPSSIPSKEVTRMFVDTMQWLLKTGYYSKEQYNNLADVINKSLNEEQ